MDRESYRPASWEDDRERCNAAKIPDERGFATKPELARAIVLRALASPLPIALVTADAAHGQEWRFRRMLKEAAVGYELALPKSQPVPRFGRIDHPFSQAPDEAWEQRSCGDGATGPRVYDWAAVQLPVIEDFDRPSSSPAISVPATDVRPSIWGAATASWPAVDTTSSATGPSASTVLPGH